MAASPNDIVLVADGDYDEAIDLLGKAITVRSTDPGNPAVVAATVIDGFHLGVSVVTCNSGEGPNTILSGLTIARGDTATGGGMLNANGSSPTVDRCTFLNNAASSRGAGMYNDGSHPIVMQCNFITNDCDYLGGGMFNMNSNPVLTDCLFDGNSAVGGGGIYNLTSGPMVTDSTFRVNSATNGGGMHSQDSNPTVTGCKFTGNGATAGGGMANRDSPATVTSCVFTGNTSTGGGGMHNSNSNSLVTNCMFSSNSGTSGGGMDNYNSEPTLINCSFTNNWSTNVGAINNASSNLTLINCILWGDYYIAAGGGQNEIWNYNSTTTVSYSDVEGVLSPGTVDAGNNISSDPLFVNVAGVDGVVGTLDDNLRLSAGSPCLEAGDNSAVTELTDLDGNPRIVACSVDMGAYEDQAAAGAAFCFGDGTGATCPCSAVGGTDQGCPNSGPSGGARLDASGSACFMTDTFQLQVSGIPGVKPGLCVKGSVQLGAGNGIAAGDGLLCTSPQLRSQVILSDSGGNVIMDNWRGQPIGTYLGAANVGAPTYYQWWYRDPDNTCSGHGFNFANAWGVEWRP